MSDKLPIYCFKLDAETFELTRIEITDYETIKCNSRRHIYKWEKPKINRCEKRFYLNPEKIDRFVNNKVFTFNPDREHAWYIIESTLETKLVEHKAAVEKISNTLNSVRCKHWNESENK